MNCPGRTKFALACAAVAVLAVVARFCGCLNDLWLDEVWSLKLVGGLSSPWQVFTGVHLDNNHYLNGLWLYWIGPHRAALLCRAPSVVAGAGTVIMAGLIGLRRSRASAFFGMVLTGFSYALILYGSEARGYAEAVLFSYLSFYALELYLERPRWQMALLYAASAVLGLASHLVFTGVLLALTTGSYWRMKTGGCSGKEIIRRLAACQGAPLLFLIWLYAADAGRMAEGGGLAQHSILGTYGAALAWTLGAPASGAMTVLFCGVSLAAMGAGLWLRRREGGGAAVFFAGVIVVFPILLAVLRHAEVIYIRYFIVSMAFLLLLAGDVLAWLWQGGRAGKWVCGGCMAVYLTVNGGALAELRQWGRGHYREAVAGMAALTKGDVITVDSDNDFQAPLMLDYYAGAAGEKKVEYRFKKDGPMAEWLICQKDSMDDPAPPHARWVECAGVPYEWVASYPTAPLSGLRWYLYQKRPGATGHFGPNGSISK